jgi:AcrR family transcriptional regulator
MAVVKRSPITHGGRAKLAPGSRLPAAVVRASQRERLMIALIEIVDRQGLPETTVADLIERAHVSRAAFYEQFDSLEDCFLETYDTQTGRIGAQIVSAYNAPGLTWPGRIRATMDTLATWTLAWEPAARVCLSDILTAGPGASDRHEQTIALVRNMLRNSRAAAGDRSPLSRPGAVALTGGLRRALRDRLHERGGQPASELAQELTGWWLACRLPSPSDMRLRLGGSAAGGARERRRAGAGAGAGGSGQAPALIGATGASDARVSDQSLEVDGRREKIVDAVLELAASKGYKAMTHRDIARHAKVSYSTFYVHFQNKQEALLAACAVAHERLLDAIAPALAQAPDWAHGVRGAITAYLRAAADNPEEARVVGLEVYSVGHAGLRQVDRHAEELERLLSPGFELYPETSRLAARAFAGAAIELLRHYAAEDQIAELPDTGPELSHIALAPFVGRKHAQRIAWYRPRYPAAAADEKPLALDRAVSTRRRTARS